MIAQFTAKMTNSEKAIYFLSLMSCSINKLKSSHVKILCFPILRGKKILCSRKWLGRGGGGGGGAHPAPPFPTALLCQSKIMFIFHALRK